jgi:hypothetical protein
MQPGGIASGVALLLMACSCSAGLDKRVAAAEDAQRLQSLNEMKVIEKAIEYIGRDDPTYPIESVRFEISESPDVWRVVAIFKRPSIGYTPIVDVRKSDLSLVSIVWR